jgi:2-hydroxy-4-carboxymuconate semialdehyde hemiacetal dehydrogenase
MNICVVGYGMMGQWHSEALRKVNIGLHTAVGRRPEGAKEFARRYGYRRRVLSLDEALADPAIDIVILATPSELHEEQAIKSLRAGKHTLVEIPMAMSLRGGPSGVVVAGEQSGKFYGVSHPMRLRRERESLQARKRAGDEHIRHIAGRFFIKRLENIGATGYQGRWIDNINGTISATSLISACSYSNTRLFVRCKAILGQLHPKTGIPMECVVIVETEADQTLLVHGSYHAAYRLYDKLIVTDRDTYIFDILAGTLRTADGTVSIESEQDNAARVIYEFFEAVARVASSAGGARRLGCALWCAIDPGSAACSLATKKEIVRQQTAQARLQPRR